MRAPALGLIVLAAITIAASAWLAARHRRQELVRTDPSQILANPALLELANTLGRPLYVRHCSRCHGAAFQGDRAHGVPDLAHGAWLYGNSPVDVEHTILYGIRSGHPKARNVTDMPALVRTGQITPAEAHDVVEFLESLARSPNDHDAAERGRILYFGKGNCYDCHAGDARGVTDYGTPALTGPWYLYGGDRATLYQSILNGRHGKCPAWINVLSPVQTRALAIYFVSAPTAAAAASL